MLKIFKIVCASLIFCIIISFVCKAENYTKINDLIENGKESNGKTVTIKAEAIGEPLNRGKFTWVNVNDSSNVIGVWMKKEEAKKISRFGSYKEKGDIIEIVGVFSRDCKEHGGDVDIHSSDMKILGKGYKKSEIIDRKRRDIAISLLVFTGILGVIYYRKAKL